MTNATLKHKSKPIDFQKEYEKIIKKVAEFNKFEFHSHYTTHNTKEVFKKFSLYQDSPSSITSFNTDAVL